MEKKQSKKQIQKPIPFSLRRISTEQFAILDNVFVENGDKVEISTGFSFGIDKNSQLIAVFVKINMLQSSKVFLILEAACHFHIDLASFESFLDNKTSKYIIPAGFITHLAVLSIGTARGILHAKTESTPFNRFLLPTINLADMIKEDIIL